MQLDSQACRSSPMLRRSHALGGLIFGGDTAVMSALGGLLFGFDTAVISGTNEALQKVFDLDEFWLGFTVATAMIGTIIGSFAIGKPSDVFGRKNVLFALAIGFFVSSLGCGLARNWREFVLARFLGGLAIGGASMVTPMYIAEISPPASARPAGDGEPIQYRGRRFAVLRFELRDRSVFGFDVAWRWMLGLLAVPSARVFLLIFSVPESPRSLVKRGRPAKAKKVLERLGEEDVESELAAIQASLAEQPGHVQERLFRRRLSGDWCFSPARWPCSINSPASMRCCITRRRSSAWPAPCAIRPCCNPSPSAGRCWCLRSSPCSSSTVSGGGFSC